MQHWLKIKSNACADGNEDTSHRVQQCGSLVCFRTTLELDITVEHWMLWKVNNMEERSVEIIGKVIQFVSKNTKEI